MKLDTKLVAYLDEVRRIGKAIPLVSLMLMRVMSPNCSPVFRRVRQMFGSVLQCSTDVGQMSYPP